MTAFLARGAVPVDRLRLRPDGRALLRVLVRDLGGRLHDEAEQLRERRRVRDRGHRLGGQRALVLDRAAVGGRAAGFLISSEILWPSL